MSQYRCMIQQGGNADTRRDILEQRIRAHHASSYPGEEVTVHWIAIPPGRMFTEGRPSTSSIVSSFLAHETTFEGREAYMRGVCDLWTEVTDCTDHEVVVTVTETVPTATTTSE